MFITVQGTNGHKCFKEKTVPSLISMKYFLFSLPNIQSIKDYSLYLHSVAMSAIIRSGYTF